MPGQAHALNGKLRENVHRIRHHENVRVFAETGGFDAVEDLDEAVAWYRGWLAERRSAHP